MNETLTCIICKIKKQGGNVFSLTGWTIFLTRFNLYVRVKPVDFLTLFDRTEV